MIAVEILAETLFQPSKGFMQRLTNLLQLALELRDARLQGPRALRLLFDLRMLNEIPQKTHGDASLYPNTSRRVKSVNATMSAPIAQTPRSAMQKGMDIPS